MSVTPARSLHRTYRRTASGGLPVPVVVAVPVVRRPAPVW